MARKGLLDTAQSPLACREEQFLHQPLPHLGMSVATVCPPQKGSDTLGPDQHGTTEWDGACRGHEPGRDGGSRAVLLGR